jgi:hypothetical protein
VVDVLSSVTTALSTYWTSANTDSITPVISSNTNYRFLDCSNNDYVIVYLIGEGVEAFGIGGNDWHHKPRVSISIFTTYLNASYDNVRAHLVKIKDEIVRIIKSKVSGPDSNYSLFLVKEIRDFSDRGKGMGKMSVDVELNHWGT